MRESRTFESDLDEIMREVGGRTEFRDFARCVVDVASAIVADGRILSRRPAALWGIDGLSPVQRRITGRPMPSRAYPPTTPIPSGVPSACWYRLRACEGVCRALAHRALASDDLTECLALAGEARFYASDAAIPFEVVQASRARALSRWNLEGLGIRV